MNKKDLVDIFSITIFLILLGLIVNPFKIFMPDFTQMILIGVFFVFGSIFVLYVLSEKPADERESHHLMISSRVSINLVTVVLLLALIDGTLRHSLPPIVPIAIAVIVVSKIVSLMYFRRKK